MTNNLSSCDPDSDFDEAVLRRLDLNLLVVFAMIMRHGSVQAAASRLYLGPSGVSMALSRLRDATQDRLFTRGKHGLEPTAFARALFERVGPALSAIGSAVRPLAFDPRTATGTVRIALSDDLEIVVASRLQHALADRAPSLRLVIRHGDYRRVSAILDDDIADIVLSAHPASLDGRHRAEAVFVEHFLALTSAQHGPSVLDLDTYLAARHALVSASGSARGRLDEALARLGHQRSIEVVTECFAALPFLLINSDLVATVPATAARMLAGQFGLALHRLPIESPTFPVSLAWRARDEAVPVQNWIRAVVREELAQSVADVSGDTRADGAAKPGASRRTVGRGGL